MTKRIEGPEIIHGLRDLYRAYYRISYGKSITVDVSAVPEGWDTVSSQMNVGDVFTVGDCNDPDGTPHMFQVGEPR